MLCGGPAIHLFSATELERLVCGTPLLDFRALQQAARYDGGYNADHQVGGRTQAPVSERKVKSRSGKECHCGFRRCSGRPLQVVTLLWEVVHGLAPEEHLGVRLPGSHTMGNVDTDQAKQMHYCRGELAVGGAWPLRQRIGADPPTRNRQ